jgi:hypothetical protein
MSERSEKIDREIARYKRLASGITDKPALAAIDKMLADLEAEKQALPPEPDEAAK